jgi:hypothetical protein
MLNAKQGRCAMLGRADARDKAVHMREARQGILEIQERADARAKAGQMREASPGKCASRSRQMLEARRMG